MDDGRIGRSTRSTNRIVVAVDENDVDEDANAIMMMMMNWNIYRRVRKGDQNIL